MEQTQRARVSVQFKRTFNTGNYTSLSFDLGAWEDCKEKESTEAAINRVAEKVQEQFEQLCDRIEGKMKGGKK